MLYALMLQYLLRVLRSGMMQPVINVDYLMQYIPFPWRIFVHAPFPLIYGGVEGADVMKSPLDHTVH